MKASSLILITMALSVILSCKSGKEYPALIDEIPVSDKPEDHARLSLSAEYSIYKLATTKNSKLPVAKPEKDVHYPWDVNYGTAAADKIFDQIKQSCKAISADADEYNREPSDLIQFYSEIELSPAERSEFAATGSVRSKKSILDEIKGTVKSYDLTNEKQEKIKINSNNLVLNLNGNIQEKNNTVYSGFSFETEGISHKYLSLKGFVEIEVELPIAYQHIEIGKNNIGDEITINGQTIKILEFDENAFHFKLMEGDEPDCELYFDKCANTYDDGLAIPESVYRAFRANQGLDYQAFSMKQKLLGLQKKGVEELKKDIWIYNSPDCRKNRVFLYSAKGGQTLKKTIKVPVDINTR